MQFAISEIEERGRLDAVALSRGKAQANARRIAFIYIAFALAWIYASDWLLSLVISDLATFVEVQKFKKAAFVVATAVLIYQLVKNRVSLLVDAQDQVNRGVDLLREAHERQKLAFSAAEIGSWTYDLAKDTICCDEFSALHFGTGLVTPAAIFFSMLHPDDQPLARAARELMLKGLASPRAEYRFKRADGSYRCISISASVSLAKIRGNAAYVVGTSQDITDRKAAEEALRTSQALLKAATDNTGVGLVVLDTERRYTFINRAYTAILGTATDIIGKSPSEVLGSAYETQIKPKLDRAFAGERVSYELAGPLEPSKQYSVIYEPRKTESGDVTGVTVIIFEITELRRAEAARRQVERDLKRAQAVSHTGSWGYNLMTGERWWSDETYRIYGIAAGTPVTRSMVLDAVHPDDIQGLQTAWQAILRGETASLDHRIVVDGRVKWLQQRVEVERAADGKPLMAFGTMQDVTDRKRSEVALRASEARFRGVYEHALAGINLVGWDGLVENSNPAMCKLLGYSEEELRGRHFATLIHPDDRAADVENGRRLRAGEISDFVAENRYLHKTGEPVWVRKVVSTLTDENGKPAKVFALCIDITTSRQASEALRVSEQRLKHVMAATGEGIWDWLIKTDAVQHNARWFKILGLDPTIGEHPVKSFLELIHEEDQGRVEAILAACLRGEAPYLSEHRIRRANGSFVWVQDRGDVVERDENGEALRMVGSMIDISARKVAEAQQMNLLIDLQRSEAEARRQKALQQSIFDCTPDGLLLVDLDRNIININPAFSQIFGYELEDLRGKASFVIYASEADRDAVGDHIAIGKNGVIPRTLNCRRKNGEVFPAQMTGAKMLSPGDKVVGYLGVIRDITLDLKREQALREKQRLEALGRLTGGIAHDFNNLLTVISGNIQLVDMEIEDERLKLRLSEATRATDMGARLNQRLMTFARQRRLEPVALDVNALIGSLADLIRGSIGESIQIQKDLAATPATVRVDASEMENAILNLALNARDAMPGGGTLRLETHTVEVDAESSVSFEGLPPGHYVRFSVSDTGAGMSPEVVSRAFEPFFTTKEEGKGTGLGLTTIHGFVRQSGGHVTLYSEPGLGTTVSIYLPAYAGAELEATSTAAGARPLQVNGETILVVEDNVAVRTVATERLRKLGYAVVEAANGRAAIALVAGGAAIDLVFSDIVMPGGISGFELAKRLSESNPKLNVLLTSGFPDELARIEAPTEMNVPILRKPYSQEDLARSIAKALEPNTSVASTADAK